MKYLKFFHLLAVVFLGFLLTLQGQYIYEHFGLEHDVAWLAEIELMMIIIGAGAIVFILLSIPSMIGRQHNTVIRNILVALCCMHLLILLLLVVFKI
ncbi:hypothetical protein [Colwellia sp. PAMC 21821]|uniref:hypothetical protein n=1 Tax=Colwellia sp. PAMC 21821 TaxID=1816219 RepID=UPI0009BD0916|nr:hypothetical protein [Colwellia sp. PAMC 21821]ARD45123.1 hypothetical protein A3Q33_12880 [Colwellia sp. PAMC 21821]